MGKYMNLATQMISKRLENGEAPWQRTYKAGFTRALPYNVKTGNPYNGINFIVLSMAYEDPRWLSVKQCGMLSKGKSKPIRVKKGEKAECGAIYWQWDKDVPDKDPVTGVVKIDPKTGKEMTKKEQLKHPFMLETAIFNASQIDGLPDFEGSCYTKLDPDKMIADVKKIIENCHEKINEEKPVYDECFNAMKRIVDNLLEDLPDPKVIKELSSDIALYYIAARTGVGFTSDYIQKREKLKSAYIAELKKNHRVLYRAATIAKNSVINPMSHVIEGFDFDQAKILYRKTPAALNLEDDPEQQQVINEVTEPTPAQTQEPIIEAAQTQEQEPVPVEAPTPEPISEPEPTHEPAPEAPEVTEATMEPELEPIPEPVAEVNDFNIGTDFGTIADTDHGTEPDPTEKFEDLFAKLPDFGVVDEEPKVTEKPMDFSEFEAMIATNNIKDKPDTSAEIDDFAEMDFSDFAEFDFEAEKKEEFDEIPF